MNMVILLKPAVLNIESAAVNSAVLSVVAQLRAWKACWILSFKKKKTATVPRKQVTEGKQMPGTV